MGAAFSVVGVVREREETWRDVIHVLECDFHGNVIYFTFNIKNMLMHRRLMLVVERDERFETAFKVKGHRGGLKPKFTQIKNTLVRDFLDFARVNNRDTEPLHQIGLLSQMRHN